MTNEPRSPERAERWYATAGRATHGPLVQRTRSPTTWTAPGYSQLFGAETPPIEQFSARMIPNMTQTPESRTELDPVAGVPHAVEPPPRYDDRYGRPNRLNQALAWVGIVAGVLFVVAMIFFSGFFIGGSLGGHYGGHHRGYYHHYPYGQMGPGQMMGPGQQSPTTTAPSTPRP